MTARARLGLVLMVGALLAPWLMAATADAPSLAVLTAIAAAALIGLVSTAAMGAVRAHTPLGTPTEAKGGVVVAGRSTDAPHHPLRPRAPGLV